MSEIDSLKGGIDKRLVVTGARCIDDPLDRLARLAIQTVTLSLLEILKIRRFRSCFFLVLLFFTHASPRGRRILNDSQNSPTMLPLCIAASRDDVEVVKQLMLACE